MAVNPSNAKPFLKWAGGKNQLLLEFNERLPSHIKEDGVIKRYVEPFVGGGAMFFFLKNHYNIQEAILLDINVELVMAYQVVKEDLNELIEILKDIEEKHLKMDEIDRKKNYYRIRDIYNSEIENFDYKNHNHGWIERTSQLIFMNKTCYNGLFRQNRKGEFNVPFGRYKKPKICDITNLELVNKALEDTEILLSDFQNSERFVDDETFVYLDPPYKPISKTSNFTTYSKMGFTDVDQVNLASYFKMVDGRGAYLMLSNSDPKNYDLEDDFFDKLYHGYNIERVPAKRNINRNAEDRGILNELIIRNY